MPQPCKAGSDDDADDGDSGAKSSEDEAPSEDEGVAPVGDVAPNDPGDKAPNTPGGVESLSTTLELPGLGSN